MKRKHRVRCLGPGTAKRHEEFFWSPDPVNIRLCDACRASQPDISPRFLQVYQQHAERKANHVEGSDY